MCGIAGFMTVDGAAPDPALCDRLERALLHRGPDGVGRYAEAGLALIHARLAIIGVEDGAQPLLDGDLALVANGEIYNYLELKAGPLAGISCATHSDSETILHLYRKFGLDSIKRLRGMYAFGLFDKGDGSLVVSRDPFGIKPLYYAETPQGFAFASEAQALIAAGLVVAKLEQGPARELLQLQFTTGAGTAFHGIKRLLPGETLLVRQGKVVERHRLPALPSEKSLRIGEAEALATLDAVLMDSVRVHQLSDVPYGLFLSSGIDSAAILGCMARLNEAPVQAYTASFPGTLVPDEFPEAARHAKIFGARHIKVEVTPEDFWAHLPLIAACLDDPTADYAVVPTWLLAREAAKDLKVILCGEGGDELFAGYGRYRRQIRPWWLGGRQRRRTGPFSQGGILRDDGLSWRDGILAAEAQAALPGRTKLQIAQAADCVDYLPHGLLNKLDRCLMAHGVEGRTPLLDVEVADFGFRLPQSLLLGRGKGKYLMRLWLDRQQPGLDCFARKKGFTVPVGEWIARESAKLGPLVAKDPGIVELCHPDQVLALFKSGGKSDRQAAWRLLFYALWHRRHIRGRSNEGGVFDCLAEG